MLTHAFRFYKLAGSSQERAWICIDMDNKNREYARAVTRPCRRNVLLSAADHWRCQELDLHSYENWEYAQAITRFCRHYVFLPASASTSYEHCRRPLLIQHRQGDYAKFELAPCRRTPPFPLLKSCNLRCFQHFRFFDFSTF